MSKINAGTTAGTALVITGDTTGNLILEDGGGNVLVGTTSITTALLNVNGTILTTTQGGVANLGYKVDNAGGWAQNNLIGHNHEFSQDGFAVRVPSAATNSTTAFKGFLDGSFHFMGPASSRPLTLTASGNVLVGTTTDVGAKLYVAGDATTGYLKINTGSTNNVFISLTNNGSDRWLYAINGAESGANAGSDLVFLNYNDAGAQIGTAMKIVRSSGNVYVNRTTDDGTGAVLQVNGGISGVGTALTALNASNLGSGTVPLARLSGITATEMAADYKFRTYNVVTSSPTIPLPTIAIGQTLVATVGATGATDILAQSGGFYSYTVIKNGVSPVFGSIAGGGTITSLSGNGCMIILTKTS